MLKRNTDNKHNSQPIKIPRFNEAAGFVPTKKSTATMKRIKSTNTTAEIILRKSVWSYGYRYRLYYNKIIGKPDMVFVKQRLVIFIDGDFWHGYNWSTKKERIKSNRDYWIPKIERNMQRDLEVNNKLISSGWCVMRFWEHQVKNDVEGCTEKIINYLQNYQ